MSTITFRATLWRDGESFQFVDVPETDMRAILGERGYARDLYDAQVLARMWPQSPIPQAISRLCPSEVVWKLGCKNGKRYRFTVTAEELP